MDLKRVMARLRPGENCASDLSSYEALVASWRREGGDAVTGDPPTLADCQAAWDAILADDAANPPPDVVDTLFGNAAVAALIEAINDGSLPVGQNLTRDTVKSRIRAKLP